MTPPRIWQCRVEIDGAEMLFIRSPLTVVIEALSRVLAAGDQQLYQDSRVKVELAPA